jgi:hypothetical protein
MYKQKFKINTIQTLTNKKSIKQSFLKRKKYLLKDQSLKLDMHLFEKLPQFAWCQKGAKYQQKE